MAPTIGNGLVRGGASRRESSDDHAAFNQECKTRLSEKARAEISGKPGGRPGAIILRANQAQLSLLGGSEAQYAGHQVREFCAEPANCRIMLARLRSKASATNFRARIRSNHGGLREVLLAVNSPWD